MTIFQREKRLLGTVFFAVCALLIINNTEAQSNLDYTLRPANGHIPMDQPSWDDRLRNGGNDFVTINLQGQSGNINIAHAVNNQKDCAGYTTSQPTYSVEWRRFSIKEDDNLRIFFIANSDTSLAIRKPDGTWLCNNDSYQTNTPTIDLERPRTGNYMIWIGTTNSSADIQGTLYLTIGSYTPKHYPLLFDGQFKSIGRAASHPGARLIYVDAIAQGSQLVMSIDAVLATMKGDEKLRFAAWPRRIDNGKWVAISKTNSPYRDEQGYVFVSNEFTAPYGNTVYDYWENSKPPIKLTLPANLLDAHVHYYIDLKIQVYDEKTHKWNDVDSYNSYNLAAINYTP